MLVYKQQIILGVIWLVKNIIICFYVTREENLICVIVGNFT